MILVTDGMRLIDQSRFVKHSDEIALLLTAPPNACSAQ